MVNGPVKWPHPSCFVAQPMIAFLPTRAGRICHVEHLACVAGGVCLRRVERHKLCRRSIRHHPCKWQGAAYTTDKGAFSHCTAAAKFDKGVALILAENANRSWIIGVADSSWPFRDRQSVALVLTYDGQVSGSAAREKVVFGNLPSQAVNALRKSHQLVVTASNRTLQFDLTEAGNVVAAIEVKATGDIPQNINFAIKTGALRDFLDNSAVPYQTADAGSEMKTADIARAARTYTMLISCAAHSTRGERK
jgi:hypothetical protein